MLYVLTTLNSPDSRYVHSSSVLTVFSSSLVLRNKLVLSSLYMTSFVMNPFDVFKLMSVAKDSLQYVFIVLLLRWKIYVKSSLKAFIHWWHFVLPLMVYCSDELPEGSKDRQRCVCSRTSRLPQDESCCHYKRFYICCSVCVIFWHASAVFLCVINTFEALDRQFLSTGCFSCCFDRSC